MLSTCNKTEIPPNPSKNAANSIFIVIAFICIPEIREIPLVISSIPVKKGEIKLVGICNKLNAGISIFENIPKILETPYVTKSDDSKEKVYPPYKYEIEMIKNKNFDKDMLENIRKQK